MIKWSTYAKRRRVSDIRVWCAGRGITSAENLRSYLTLLGVDPADDLDVDAIFRESAKGSATVEASKVGSDDACESTLDEHSSSVDAGIDAGFSALRMPIIVKTRKQPRQK